MSARASSLWIGCGCLGLLAGCAHELTTVGNGSTPHVAPQSTPRPDPSPVRAFGSGAASVVIEGVQFDGVQTTFYLTNRNATRGKAIGSMRVVNSATEARTIGFYYYFEYHVRLEDMNGRILWPGQFGDSMLLPMPAIFKCSLAAQERRDFPIVLDFPSYFDVRPGQKYKMWFELDERLTGNAGKRNKFLSRWSVDDILLNYEEPNGSLYHDFGS